MKSNVKKMTFIAMLTAVSMCIFIIEMQLPPLTPFPGVKMGLSNVVIMLALFAMGRKEAFFVLLMRILLCGIILGQGVSIIYSLTGGIFAFLIMAALKNIMRESLWAVSVFGAVFHNIGQLCAARVLMNSSAVFAYLPVLIISAVITGAFTGIAVQLLINKSKMLKKLFLHMENDI